MRQGKLRTTQEKKKKGEKGKDKLRRDTGEKEGETAISEHPPSTLT